MNKIQMTVPIVELDGDEMARIIWKKIKDKLIYPYIDLKSEYYDLCLSARDKSKDSITKDAAEVIRKYGVGVKCATIAPNDKRKEEYNLKRLYPNPNATIRTALDGTVFSTPIIVKGISPYVKNWKFPITVARHAYGDIYKAVEMKTGKCKAELVFTDENGKEERKLIFDFNEDGVILGQHNRIKSIESFARSCFDYALELKQDLWFSSKDTVSKIYDGEFRKVSDSIFENEYKEKFVKAGIKYFYTLVDDAIARAMKSEGGFIWACSNYDGDVMGGMIAVAFGNLSLMKSVLVSPDGKFEYEAAHGTVQRHFYKYQKGKSTSTNSVATIFAWTGALRKRGQLDDNKELQTFADKMEKAVSLTIESGKMTKDLSEISELPDKTVLDTFEFIDAVKCTFDNVDLDNFDTLKEDKTSILYEKFLDSRTVKEKREILQMLRPNLTDKMINDFAVIMDVTVPDSEYIDDRYYSLMRCLDTMARFETTGLR